MEAPSLSSSRIRASASQAAEGGISTLTITIFNRFARKKAVKRKLKMKSTP